MAEITLKGSKVETAGELPNIGETAPDFTLTKIDLSDVSLADFGDQVKILNIVPSLDTGICAQSMRTFNEQVADLDNTVVLTISRDLPFAAKRFCEAEGIDRAVGLSELRNRTFGDAYNVEMVSGPMAGLLSRAVVVLDSDNKVVYTEQVPEIAQEPDYDAALEAAKNA